MIEPPASRGSVGSPDSVGAIDTDDTPMLCNALVTATKLKQDINIDLCIKFQTNKSDWVEKDSRGKRELNDIQEPDDVAAPVLGQAAGEHDQGRNKTWTHCE